MLAIGTKYACNLDHDGDQICLQSRIFLNSFLTQDNSLQGVFKIFEIAGIHGPQQIRLQAYMVPFLTEIAGIFGPQHYQDCTHIWSLLQPKLQA